MIPMQKLPKLFEAAIFAARKHQGQVRKDRQRSPYVTHPLSVAKTIIEIGQVDDETILMAAILHDTIEDTDTNNDEVREAFGEKILSIVLEVSDDKSLPKVERKRLQIVHAPALSHSAKIIKLADKLINCRDVLLSPPEKWSLDTRREYFQWSADVIAQIRDTNTPLEAAFDEILITAQKELDFTIQPFSSINQRY